MRILSMKPRTTAEELQLEQQTNPDAASQDHRTVCFASVVLPPRNAWLTTAGLLPITLR